MPRYHRRDGAQVRWWELERDGLRLSQRWGVGGVEEGHRRDGYGSAGQATLAWLQALHARAVDGYRLALPPSAEAATSLEAAIERDPGPPDAWLVYADWLQQHGDPRGELAALQHRRATRAQVEQYVSAQRQALLGPLAPVWETEGLKLSWRYGFIRGANVIGGASAGLDVHEVVQHLLALPAARFIEALEVSHPMVEHTFAPLIASGRAERLQRLVLSGQSWWSSERLQPVLDACAQLDQLVVRHLGATESGVRHATLRLLSLTNPLRSGSERTLGGSALPRLRTLSVLPTPQCPLERALHGRFPSLEVLSLVGDRYGPKLLEALDAAKVLRGLKQLRFSQPAPQVVTALEHLVPRWPWLSRVELAARLTPARRAALAKVPKLELRGRASPLAA